MKIVIALGGNALGNSAKEQIQLVKQTAEHIVDLIEEGHQVVVSHGNGPQVGMINLALASQDMPFPECTAMSQGYIGYHLQNAIREKLLQRDIHKNVVSIITQVEVDENDTAFQNKTKPVGGFYSKEEAEKLSSETGEEFKEDSGRGYRRVVASPKPVDIIELDTIKLLSDSGVVVIASGGGGVPVVKKQDTLIGTPAVIDKDFASSLLALKIDADMLIILTQVEFVSINFGKPNQENLTDITTSEAKKYIEENQFAKGSMLPKVEASILFAESNPSRKSLITSLEKAKLGIQGRTGTLIRQG